MRYGRIALIFVLLALAGAWLVGDDEPPVFDIKTISFDDFDQDMDGGWRYYARRGQRGKAAELIAQFIAENPSAGPYLTVLHFHAGQNLAYDGLRDAAIEQFKQSFSRGQKTPYGLQWDAYVRGTIAFLEKDMPSLQTALADLKAGPEGGMRDSNSRVLQGFIDNFDETYSNAY